MIGSRCLCQKTITIEVIFNRKESLFTILAKKGVSVLKASSKSYVTKAYLSNRWCEHNIITVTFFCVSFSTTKSLTNREWKHGTTPWDIRLSRRTVQNEFSLGRVVASEFLFGGINCVPLRTQYYWLATQSSVQILLEGFFTDDHPLLLNLSPLLG